jgi:hypothetical protein
MIQTTTSAGIAQNPLLVAVLTESKFLIVDSAPQVSEFIKSQLLHLCNINEIQIDKLNYEFADASNESTINKIKEYNNIVVATSFTTIKNDNIENLINAGVALNLSNKNIFSLMDFSTVGSSFEDYKDEVLELAKNNVHFYFIGQGSKSFELYE